MGIVFGSVEVEQPSYLVEHFFSNWQVRRYNPYIVAETTFQAYKIDGKERNDAYRILGSYIGEFGAAHNTSRKTNKPEKMQMAAPVIIKQISQKKDNASRSTYKICFVLPSKFQRVEDVPIPQDQRVTIRQIPERFVAVTTFNGHCTTEVACEKAKNLLKSIQEDGTYTFLPPEHEHDSYYDVAYYNPPFTVPFLRTNEVMIPVRSSAGVSQPYPMSGQSLGQPQQQQQQQHQQTLPGYTPVGGQQPTPGNPSVNPFLMNQQQQMPPSGQPSMMGQQHQQVPPLGVNQLPPPGMGQQQQIPPPVYTPSGTMSHQTQPKQ